MVINSSGDKLIENHEFESSGVSLLFWAKSIQSAYADNCADAVDRLFNYPSSYYLRPTGQYGLCSSAFLF